jgi:hypothetical protein
VINEEWALLYKQSEFQDNEKSDEQKIYSHQDILLLERDLYRRYSSKVIKLYPANRVTYLALPVGMSYSKMLFATDDRYCDFKSLSLRERSDLKKKRAYIITLPDLESFLGSETINELVMTYFNGLAMSFDYKLGIDHLIWDIDCALEFGQVLFRDIDDSAEKKDTAHSSEIELLQQEIAIDLKNILIQYEKKLIEKALEVAKGNKCKAGRLLGLNRTTLIEKCKRL